MTSPLSGRPPRLGRPPPTSEDIPLEFGGSLPEYLVYQELLRRGLTRERDFVYQGNFFGRKIAGAIEVDFLIYPDLALAIQGVFVHYERGIEQRARDRLNRARIESQGFKVVFLDEDNVMEDVEFYVGEALRYIDHSRMTRGIM